MTLSCMLIWWAPVGVEFHGSDLAWLFPEPRFPTVAFTVIKKNEKAHCEPFGDSNLPQSSTETEIWSVDTAAYHTWIGNLHDKLMQLIISVVKTIPNPVILTCANYLDYDFDSFQKWASEQSISLPIFSAQASPGNSPFYVLHEVDFQMLLNGTGFFAGSNQWLETTLGIGFFIASRESWLTKYLLESQGICFDEGNTSGLSIDFESHNWSKGDLIRYVAHRALGNYELLKPFEAMIVPYGDEVREQILFVHRHLSRDYMIRLVQTAFKLPLVVSWPSPEELKAWDWSLKLPQDIEWIINLSEPI